METSFLPYDAVRIIMMNLVGDVRMWRTLSLVCKAWNVIIKRTIAFPPPLQFCSNTGDFPRIIVKWNSVAIKEYHTYFPCFDKVLYGKTFGVKYRIRRLLFKVQLKITPIHVYNTRPILRETVVYFEENNEIAYFDYLEPGISFQCQARFFWNENWWSPWSAPVNYQNAHSSLDLDVNRPDRDILGEAVEARSDWTAKDLMAILTKKRLATKSCRIFLEKSSSILMEEDRQLCYYRMKNYDAVKVLNMKFDKSFPLLVKTRIPQHHFYIEVGPKMTIKQVKEKLPSRLVGRFTLHLENDARVLEDHRTMSNIGLNKKTCLIMDLSRNYPIIITVIPIHGNPFQVEVNVDTTLGQLGSSILVQHPAFNGRLVYAGKKLELFKLKDSLAYDHGMEPNHYHLLQEFHSCEKLVSSYCVYVRTTNGVYNTKLESDWTVLRLKHLIHNWCGVSVERQRIMFAGRILDDCKTISDSLLSRESILHLLVKRDSFV